MSCHSLRIWERRYGFPVPRRKASGHRRYDQEQVEQLLQIAAQLQSGKTVGEVLGSLKQLSSETKVDQTERVGTWADGERIDGLLEHLFAARLPAAEAEYERLASGLDAVGQIHELIEPALVETGERWFRGHCQIYQERCASGFLRRKLLLLLDAAQAGNTRPVGCVLVGTVRGERHEGGALMISTLLELRGWRAIALGTDLPCEEYQRAIDLWKPAGACVSFVMSRNITKRFQELAGLRGARVFVGGRSILNYCGLARKHGLVPLPGSGSEAVNLLLRELALGSRDGA